MKIAVIGLGLIGGSIAKGFKKYTDYDILGYDTDAAVMEKALETGAIDRALGDELPECGIVVLGLYPETAIAVMQKYAPLIGRNTVVTDCGGVKEKVCRGIFPIAKEYGFTFIGAHPMAGIERFGFDWSKADMFEGASLILTPFEDTPAEKTQFLWNVFSKIGFSRLQMSTPEEHDRIIAYTSQLAHVVSSSYIKSPTAMKHTGFSAGSFRDMTRVARLNEDMWTELFLENADNLAKEIDFVAEKMHEFSDAIKARDAETLRRLLKEGREKKELSEKCDMQ